jgi:glycosyltransferase involved in cell wall biosynthesis
MSGNKLKLCFIADIQSIHAQKWIKYFCHEDSGFQVAVINTGKYYAGFFHNSQVYNLAARFFRGESSGMRKKEKSCAVGRLNYWQLALRRYLYLYKLDFRILSWYNDNKVKCFNLVKEIGPDILHALRLPSEGYLAGESKVKMGRGMKFVISTWGNDFSYFSRRNPVFYFLTKRAVSTADFLFSDCCNDVKKAITLGLKTGSCVVPGAGGIEDLSLERDRLSDFVEKKFFWKSHGIDLADSDSVFFFIRPPCFYTNDGPVLKALSALDGNTKLIFLRSFDMVSEKIVKLQLARYGLTSRTYFLEHIPHNKIGDYIRNVDFIVSSGFHDGTPNSLLETMWFGAIPISNDLPSIREWINPGENGYIFNIRSGTKKIVAVLKEAIKNRGAVKESMMRRNRMIIREKANYNRNMMHVKQIYMQLKG